MGGLLTFELDWDYAALYIFKLHPDMDRVVLALGLNGLNPFSPCLGRWILKGRPGPGRSENSPIRSR